MSNEYHNMESPQSTLHGKRRPRHTEMTGLSLRGESTGDEEPYDGLAESVAVLDTKRRLPTDPLPHIARAETSAIIHDATPVGPGLQPPTTLGQVSRPPPLRTVR